MKRREYNLFGDNYKKLLFISKECYSYMLIPPKATQLRNLLFFRNLILNKQFFFKKANTIFKIKEIFHGKNN